MSTQLATVNKPQIVKAPVNGRASIALFPSDRADGQPVHSIVRFTASGALRGVSVPLHIDPGKGEAFGLSTGYGKDRKTTFSLTALGYDRMNTVAAVQFFTLPERLFDNTGKERPNPWVEQDEYGGILFVRVARIGFGRVVTGNLVARALSVTYDLRTYLSQDLWSKWQGKKGWDGGSDPDKAKPGTIAKAWGRLTAATEKAAPDPAHLLPVRIVGLPVILWCDQAHPEVQTIFGEHINRQKFAERNALTICDRNILKKFFGVSKLGADMRVQVTGFIQEDRDLMAMGRAVAAAQAGEIVIDGERVEIEREDAGVMGKDEADEALQGNADEDAIIEQPEEDQPAGVAPSTPAAQSGDDPERAGLREKIRKLCGELEHGEDILIKLEFEGLAEIGRCGDTAHLKDALAALEREQCRVKQEERAPAKATTAKPASKGALFDNSKRATTDPPVKG